MTLSELSAISPIDGRYRNKVKNLAPYFSEFGLIKYRVLVEVEYFIALCDFQLPELKGISTSVFPELRNIYKNFTENDAQKIKDIEKTTNHDVKAVEYFIKEKFDQLKLQDYKEFIHFGLTSQDVNNTAIPLSFKEGLENEIYPVLNEVIEKLKSLAEEWKDVAMLAKTHGQPASPTRMGKEILVFVERLEKQLEMLKNIPFGAKFGGATGNFNAHHVAYPELDWKSFANNFVNKQLGLDRSQYTTQIEHYDYFAASCDTLKRINNIIIDLDRDFWMYISAEYFKQKVVAGEVGSSAMPHKVNPIDFENAEGNAGIANAIFEHLAAKLPISRLQRDLTDSTVLRNIGTPLSHTLIAFHSTLKGLGKLLLNQKAFDDDLNKNWVVVAEAIQTVLRRHNYPSPYEALKGLTRGNQEISQESIHAFIDTLDVNDELKTYLKTFTPFNYTGI